MVSPYAEESLRVLHEGALHSCKTLIKRSDAAALALAITQLEAREQVVLALVYFEGFEISEVAGILALPVQDVIRSHALAVFALIDHLPKITAEAT